MKLMFLFTITMISFAQTNIKVNQIQGPISNTLRLMVMTANGKAAELSLGTGLGVSNGQLVLLPVMAPIVTIVATRLTLASDGTFIITPDPALFTRNGLVQELGKDYTIANGRLVPVLNWDFDDVVIQHGIKSNVTSSTPIP